MANIIDHHINQFGISQSLRESRTTLTPIQNFVNGVCSSTLARTIFYPLDVVQIILQTNSEDARDGILPTLKHIYEKYGIWSWFRGNIASCSMACALAAGSFIEASPMFRDAVRTPLAGHLMSALVTILVFPLQVVKVRMITHPTKYVSTIETLRTIYNEEELPSLYKGMSATLLGIANDVLVTTATFQLMAMIWKKPKESMSIREHIISVTLATVLAGMIQYPVETAVRLVQSQPNGIDNVVRTIMNTGRTPREGGLQGLFRGCLSYLVKPLAIPLQWVLADWSRVLLFNGRSLL
jgi:hypothetical protein